MSIGQFQLPRMEKKCFAILLRCFLCSFFVCATLLVLFQKLWIYVMDYCVVSRVPHWIFLVFCDVKVIHENMSFNSNEIFFCSLASLLGEREEIWRRQKQTTQNENDLKLITVFFSSSCCFSSYNWSFVFILIRKGLFYAKLELSLKQRFMIMYAAQTVIICIYRNKHDDDDGIRSKVIMQCKSKTLLRIHKDTFWSLWD